MSRFELERFRSLRAITFGIVIAFLTSLAQTQNLQSFSHQSWSTEEGLPQSSVHAIAQTTDGYIWAGTEAGLVRFDGLQFKIFDQRTDPIIQSSDICCLVQDTTMGLWIGTRNGLVHHTSKGSTFFGEKDGLPSSEITNLSTNPDGSLLITTSAGSIKWPHSSLPTNSLNAAPVWTSQEVHLPSPTPTLPWRVGKNLPAGRVNTVAIDSEGLAWVGMSTGVVVIDPTTRVVTELSAMKGLSILSILHDAQGNHWLGTESSGLHIFRQLRFHDVPALAQVATTSIAQATDGTFWIGTRDSGLYRLRDRLVNQPIPASALTSPIILCLQPAFDGSGRLWVGTPDGLNLVLPDKSVQKITSLNGLPDDYIRSLAASSDGSIWVGTRHGLDHIRDSRHTVFTSMNGLGGDLIGAMLIESRALWVATSGGLSRIAANGSIQNFTPTNGLPSPIVTALAKDASGHLWVATKDSSLSFFDGQQFIPLLQLNQEFAFRQSAQSLTFGRDGSLWLRMDRGIFRIRPAQLSHCLNQHPCTLQSNALIHYSGADGLHNDEAVSTALATPWLTSQGDLWFPTRSGVAIANTLGLPKSQTPPVVIQQLLLDDAPLDIANTPELPFGNHRLSSDYAGLDYTSPAGVHYRERLDDFDKDWQYVENRRSVTYTNLAPGLYTFHVQARTTDGDWSDADTTLQFRILPPFYRRWWFVALVVLLVAAILAAVIHLRAHVLRHRFEAVLAERNRMAREIHDTLTQDFVSTCLQLDIVAQQLNNNLIDQAKEQVKQARRLVTEGLAEARQSIWELRSNNGRETLPNRLQHLVERESYATIKPHLEVHGAYRALDPRIELEILRLTNEALVNVVRHSGTDRTSIMLHYSTEALMLTVEDFGSGFEIDDATQKPGHFGLLGMKERASVVDGTLEIVSLPKEGTTIRLRVPLGPNQEEHS